jgi:hypothetical protein
MRRWLRNYTEWFTEFNNPRKWRMEFVDKSNEDIMELTFFLCVNTESRRGKAPRILNYGNVWKYEDSLTPKLLASGKLPLFTIWIVDLVEFPNRSGLCVEEKCFPLPGNRTNPLWKWKPLNLLTVKSVLSGAGVEMRISTPGPSSWRLITCVTLIAVVMFSVSKGIRVFLQLQVEPLQAAIRMDEKK